MSNAAPLKKYEEIIADLHQKFSDDNAQLVAYHDIFLPANVQSLAPREFVEDARARLHKIEDTFEQKLHGPRIDQADDDEFYDLIDQARLALDAVLANSDDDGGDVGHDQHITSAGPHHSHCTPPQPKKPRH